MKIICSKSSLLSSVNVALKAVPSKPSLPVLECILLVAEQDGFYVVGNDLEMGIKTTLMPCQVVEEGSVALEAKVFFEIIRSLPDDLINIAINDKNAATISCGNSEFNILGICGTEFPLPLEVEKLDYVTVSAVALKAVIRQTIFSVSVDESRQVLTGELVEAKDGNLNIVSIDGYRISFRQSPLILLPEKNKNFKNLKCIVPAKAMQEIVKIIPSEVAFEQVKIYFGDKHILFELENCTVTSRVIAGEYLRYDQIFTTDYTTKVTIERRKILQSLERVSLIAAREQKKNPVMLKVENDTLSIASQTETGAAKDQISVESDGGNIEIAFNPKYLIDALRAIDEEFVCFLFTTSLSPCIISGAENDSGKYLILPLRIK